MRIALFLLSIFIFHEGLAAGGVTALSFYRSQQSLFPSGQASRTELEKKVLRRELEPWFRIRWNQKEYEIPGELLVKDSQTTQTLIAKEKIEILKSPLAHAAPAFSLQANQTVVVLKTDAFWAQVLEPKLKLKGWAPLHAFTAPIEDKGIFLTLVDSFMHKAPAGSAEILTTIPRGQRLIPRQIVNNFLEVKYKNLQGYIELGNLVGRGDFAMWAYHKHKGWLGISHRENGFLITVDKQKVSLRDFIAFSPYHNRGVITRKPRTNSESPSIRSRVEILNKQAHRWTLSQLDGHGQVWWRAEEAPTQVPNNKNTITSEQLMKRKIHSVAFAPGKSLKGLASAEGVFRTEDGKTWSEIPQFEGKNHPVSIHPDGLWYVGSYRSSDEGKTFENYIKWDKLTEQIQDSIHKTPRHLRITKIEPLSHSRVRILVDTGAQKVKLQAHVLSQEWTLVK